VIAKKLALALVTGAIAMAGLAGTAQAYQVGDTCQVNTGGNAPGGGWYVINWVANYIVTYPNSVIIDSLSNGTYVHQAGKPSGFIDPAGINSSTCHH